MKDYGIVHLTDLHYPVRGAATWRTPILDALELISGDETIEIRGIAITGDMTDSPSGTAFENAANFADKAAETLKLGTTKEERRSRIWAVDGNHDYRAFGNVRVSWKGIESGEHFSRLETAYDGVSGVYLLGINTANRGLLARGGVADTELARIAKAESLMQRR